MCCISIVYDAHEMAIIHIAENNPFPVNGHNQIRTRYIIQRTLALQRPCHHRMKEKQNRNEYAHDRILAVPFLLSGTCFIVPAICEKTRCGMLGCMILFQPNWHLFEMHDDLIVI
jgi:hypothetical protein